MSEEERRRSSELRVDRHRRFEMIELDKISHDDICHSIRDYIIYAVCM
jgi:hypothetical protein